MAADPDRDRAADGGEVYLLPASFAQERLWFLDRFEPDSPQFNIPAAFHLRGDLDPRALNRALSDLVERHETLRTTFTMEDGKLRQVVSPADPLPLLRVDASELTDGRRRESLRRLALREARTPFHLGRGPLFRATLVDLGAGEHALFLTLHHIVADGWSMRVLYRELEALYGARREGGDAGLRELPIQYADYAAWQREELQGEVLEEKVDHWRRELEGAPELVEIPPDRPRPSVRSNRGAQAFRELPPNLGQGVADLAASESATAFMVLMAAFQALLHHHTHRRDLVVGTAVANRPQRQLERLIGFFVNTLPLRVSLDGDPTFRELVNRVKRTALEAFDHQDAPFERLVEELAPGRNPSHTPLIQVMFLFEEQEEESLYLPEVEVRPVPVDTGTSKYDLTFAVAHRGGRFTVRANYNTDLYRANTVHRLLAGYRTLLAAAVEDPDRPVSTLPVMDAARRHQVVHGWNDTALAPAERRRLDGVRLHHGFEGRAAEAPDALAVVTADDSVSYGELDARANRLAHHLRSAGVAANGLVGIHLRRSPRMVEAVLAVHKAGGAYVPLEAEWPEQRIRWIVEHHGLSLLVAEEATREKVSALEADGTPVISLDREDDRHAVADRPADAPPDDAGAGPEDLAYIIFTSGSTGRPKGVVVRHRPAVNLVRWVNSTFEVGPADRLLFVTSLAFDLSVYDLFGILAAGATVRLATADELLDPQQLVRVLREEPITFWDSAPAALQQCGPYLSQVGDGEGDDLRRVFLSGDWIPLGLPDRVREAFPNAGVVALGGATEATVWSNFFRVGEVDDEWASIPYGRPIAGARYHVLDPTLKPCPPGVPGDLYIGGEVLSTGYAGAPRQTAAAFLPDPFADARPEAGPGERLYRTGDRARHRPDGVLEFLGRLDNQVKVRGYRIELGEIEAVLADHPGVREVVVLAREDKPGNQRLVAYLVPEEPDRPPAEEELAERAEEHLPTYMLPAAYVLREEWPLSPTGKLDRDALPTPEEAAEDEEAAARAAEGEGTEGAPDAPEEETAPASGAGGVATVPTTRGEARRVIAAVWADVLESDEISYEESFFDQGGNSLLLTEVHVALQERFDREIPMLTLFRHPSVSEMAAELVPEEAQPAEPAEAAEPAVATAPETAPEPGVTGGPVAVVGMAGRFPGAGSVEALWELLAEGREGIRFFSDEELLKAGVDPERLDDDHYVKGRGALDDPELFDAGFFGLSPREAQILDPQQRLFLEVAWHALEDAGHPPRGSGLRAGVFAGVSDNGYRGELMADPEILASAGRFPIQLGNQVDYVATRLAYKLDLTGPAMTVQTACSTSLVAVHLACRALLAGDCDLAVAGGASVQEREVTGYPFLDGGIDSPDGHTRAFDADAAGSVAGSGVAAVVLKRLDDALADGDPIRAVVRGTALNNDGGRKVGFTAPSADGQAAVIRAAQEAAGVEPGTVGYVETHGTATPMGDPIEIAGLKKAWAEGGGDGGGGADGCVLGSVKSNLGHLDAAAGVAGLIKAVLALEHGEIPPSLHFRQPNPELEIEDSPFHVAAEREPWPGGDGPRRAGVSSFGIGGTNAHAVLEEAPPRPEADDPRPPRPAQLLRLAARSPAALADAARALADRLRETDPADNGQRLADVAYTLEVGRRAFRHRAAAVARSPQEAAEALAGSAPLTGEAPEEAPPLVFLYPGQGAQHPGMGGDLYAEEPVFRRAVDRCCELLEPDLGFDLREVLFPLDGEDGAAADRLRRTAVAQPALLTVEHALTELLASWGLRPAAVAGHSIGEYAAALAAGVFDLPDALALVAERGRLMDSLPAGDMLAVRRGAGEVETWLEEHPEVELATVNAPDAVVVSGPAGAVERFAAKLRDEHGVEEGELRPLHTSHAFHSAMMEPILEPFEERVAAVDLSPPALPVASNLSGTRLTAEEATDPAYWARHLRGAVRFAEDLDTLLEDPAPALLELGPGRALSTFARRHPRGSEAPAVCRALPHPQEDRGDLDLLLEAVGRLWTVGVESDPEAFWAGQDRRRVALPGYPFQRRRYWFDGIDTAPAEETAPPRDAAEEPLSDTEAAVAEAWEELLGVAGVDRDDDFFDLGGSSLAGVTLASRLENLFDVSLPSSFLLEASTLEELSAMIDERRDGDAEPAPSPCRVRLQKGAAGRPPLFLVHQVGGHVFTFRELGREMGDDQPLFGLRSHGLEAGEDAFATVGEMADHYLGLLDETQPRGPVLLGGASMGGMVAWEMARRLAEDGRPPSLLVMMDTPCGDQMPAREDNAEAVSFVLRERLADAWEAVEVDPEALRRRPFDERWERAEAALREAASRADVDLDALDLDEAARQARVLHRNVEALYSYQPEPLPLRLLYFRAAERRPGDPPRPELPWIELAEGGCETVVVPGDHESMHRPPGVEVMARELRRRLDLAADERCRRLLEAARPTGQGPP